MSDKSGNPGKSGSDAGLSSALRAGRALILLQLLSRLLTFALNQGLVRLASPAVFGTASIQFDLIAATVLFLSREGVRNALLRGGTSNGGGRLAQIPQQLGLAVAAATVGLYLYTSPVSTKAQKDFYPALALYVMAALNELAIEPFYIACMRDGRMRVRVQAEGGMAIVRAVVSFACLYLFPDHALLGFAVGHFAGAAWLAARYISAGGALQGDSGDEKIRSLAWANTRQSVVKHVLTEADRIAVGRISPLGDQGGYAVAMNYGMLQTWHG
ncbi:oligosaccharide transporter [Trichosporon asahii var. asahii CBS 2479]|uniref:Man(5)GlcNAc(2)-PP-dolichol translocation protein RFT1 n=1 Tax=Trichosporon asahii var. asahii (strain ATCC 90039 / CBS 2479 / JCM 2466 / KCTC 7840 / NBRC 103889/ NCYC 2677 / UAMH 7654) TaxID=1186058 RepID=J5R9S5_TRIAS|nr:oligosaccharide transporter [Trichosporon asahii var. asahii CBS 2479]EJT51448.1 oligosaccharide transporter [Trichosporon asahii var. asahii CBS 2479]